MKKITLLIIYFLLSTFSTAQSENFNYNELGQIPVLYNGRIQPFDSLARYSLLIIREKTKVIRNTEKITATQWLWEVFSHNKNIYTDKVFLIDNPEVQHELNLSPNRKVYSFNEIKNKISLILAKASALKDKDNKSAYETNIIHLGQKITLFNILLHTFLPFDKISFHNYFKQYSENIKNQVTIFNNYNEQGQLNNQKEKLTLVKFNQDFKRHLQLSKTSNIYLYVFTNEDKNIIWSNTGEELLKHLDYNYTSNPLIVNYANLNKYYESNNINKFNSELKSSQNQFKKILQNKQTLVKLEYYFNKTSPFIFAMILYIAVFLLSGIFYLINSNILFKLSKWICYIAFSVHSLGLIARMLIQQRPPVTNLYSSSVFVGWVAIALSLLQEKIFKNKLGYFISSILGFTTLIIAYHLSFQIDTLEQMQAVLDSNFWLTTHVITITLGYSGTFLAGLIGTIYIFKEIFKIKSIDNKTLYTMAYSLICFSLFFSFIGTVLGGIWADQSWGRFWGWDPKENGALLIVIFNSMILHFRLSGIFKIKGIMIMCILGNIVTAFSWFGVNMLGVGLHSYGFMNSAVQWLILYISIQVVIAYLGFNFIKDDKFK
jgi:ABC-type transport system involved in cytochrome c biogenesis permease subunit